MVARTSCVDAVECWAPPKKPLPLILPLTLLHCPTPSAAAEKNPSLQTGAYCVPGTSQGGRSRNQYRTKMTCPALNQALLDDGAVKVTRQQALSGGQPSSGHYIAIMARPDNSCVPGHCSSSDFHAMRKDSSSTWSYKFPHTAPSDRDLAGNPIIDPEAAPLPGHYFVCGYFQVDPLKVGEGVWSTASQALSVVLC